MRKVRVPSAEMCHQVLRYEAKTGKLFWRHRPNGPAWWNTRYADKEAFTALDTDGYRQGAIHGVVMRAQYPIWVMNYETLPEVIDHENRVRTDNRLENLRASSPLHNANNRGRKEGVGVYPNGSKFRARIRVGGVMNNLGSFATEGEARAAYEVARRSVTAMLDQPKPKG